MATKAELLEKAREEGLDVNTKTTKADLESMLGTSSTSTKATSNEETSGGTDNAETVEVNDNDDGEATHGTVKEGSEAPVENTESVPQNGVGEIETLQVTDDPIALEADESRTEDEIKFADESNPNQKARNVATEGAEFDQDGLRRTGGKSYGVSADDPEGTVFDEQNKGEEPEDVDDEVINFYENAGGPSLLHSQTNHQEWTYEEQKALEDKLSDPKAGIKARVTTSVGDYVRVKFFYNNKPLGTYKSRAFKAGEAQKFLKDLRERVEV